MRNAIVIPIRHIRELTVVDFKLDVDDHRFSPESLYMVKFLVREGTTKLFVSEPSLTCGEPSLYPKPIFINRGVHFSSSHLQIP